MCTVYCRMIIIGRNTMNVTFVNLLYDHVCQLQPLWRPVLLGGGRSHSTGPFFCFTQDNEKSDIAVEEFMLHCFAESDLWKPLHMAQWWNSIACVNLLIWFDVFFSAQRMEFLLNREILLNINVAHYFSVLWWFCDTKLLQIRGVTLKPKYATTLLFRGGNNWWWNWPYRKYNSTD